MHESFTGSPQSRTIDFAPSESTLIVDGPVAAFVNFIRSLIHEVSAVSAGVMEAVYVFVPEAVA